MVGLEVINGLSLVYVHNFFDCFQFNHHTIFDKKVHSSGTNLLIAIENGHFHFPFKKEIGQIHFNGQRPLINHLLKTIAQKDKQLDDFEQTVKQLEQQTKTKKKQ